VTNGSKVLITGAAGFIGFHLSRRLCSEGYEVVGLDNLNDYYDVGLKNDRVNVLKSSFPSFSFIRVELADNENVKRVFKDHQFTYVVNLAAQAGVRYSIDHPHSYIDSNVIGFLNILEGCRHNGVKHLVYASSGAVYGANRKCRSPRTIIRTIRCRCMVLRRRPTS
jgi:UDP-glucuronate 4-epimerase